jgi:transposase-like protein
MVAPMELLTNSAGRRRNRQCPDEVKARIVAETLRPGATVGEVAQRLGLKAHHSSSWLRSGCPVCLYQVRHAATERQGRAPHRSDQQKYYQLLSHKGDADLEECSMGGNASTTSPDHTAHSTERRLTKRSAKGHNCWTRCLKCTRRLHCQIRTPAACKLSAAHVLFGFEQSCSASQCGADTLKALP